MQLFVKNWNKGLITRIEKNSVARGSASDCLNWHFLGDKIELRRGQKLLGTEVAGAGRVNFVKVGTKYDGTQIPFWGYARKALYYNDATEDSIEISTNIFTTEEDISVTLYQSLAGSFLYLSSPNNSVYKIPVANPGSAVDLLENTYRGYLRANSGRMFLFNRKDKFGGSDKTGLELSAIDRDSLADYDFTSAEDLGTGDGSTKTFTGTLAFKATDAKETCHFVRIAAATSALVDITGITAANPGVITAAGHGLAVGDVAVVQDVTGMTQINKRIAVVTAVSGNNVTIDIDTSGFSAYSSGGKIGKAELFTDDRSGGLSGNQSGTGTINYATGAFSVTFTTAPVSTAEVVSDYYREDSTDQGIIDFDQGNGSSIADSLTFRQDDAGFLQFIGSIGSTHYCIHTIKTYALRLISTSEITNLVFREKVGIPYFRGAEATGEGIYYMDVTDPQNPQFRILELQYAGTEVVPRSISNGLDLSIYTFDQSKVIVWGDYRGFTCKSKGSTINDRLFLYHTIWKTWEAHNIRISDADTWNGALIVGDSGSNNIYKIFSGLADEDAIVENYFITGNDFLNYEGVKDLRRMKVAGEIGDDQRMDVSYSIDNSAFVFIKTIEGSGSYVDKSQKHAIGAETLGEIIGGGAATDSQIFASPYEIEFNVGTSRFQRIRFKFVATGVGYLSVSEYGLVDIREKGLRLPTKYVS